ncbi:MAG TPA: hypothetical protein DEU67_07440 [Acidobacteria bacterium]|nr:hypothetical protein [Acidobacteriota bacterium]|tara:strand:+ start:1739 stop:1978 length:240 start_codon:yes stop_codon:yes gene_type:complete
MLGIARCTASLSDFVRHHSYNGMIRDAALTRTIIIHAITKPKPTLLHQSLTKTKEFKRSTRAGGESLAEESAKTQLPRG